MASVSSDVKISLREEDDLDLKKKERKKKKEEAEKKKKEEAKKKKKKRLRKRKKKRQRKRKKKRLRKIFLLVLFFSLSFFQTHLNCFRMNIFCCVHTSSACQYVVYTVPDLFHGNVSQNIFSWAHFSLLLHKDGFLLFSVVTSQLGCQLGQWYMVSSMGPASLPQHHITVGNIDIFGYSLL